MSHFVPRYFLDVLVHPLTFTKSSILGWFASLIFTCCCRCLFFVFFFYVRKEKKNIYIISEKKKKLGFWSVRIVTGAAKAASRENREGTRELNLRTKMLIYIVFLWSGILTWRCLMLTVAPFSVCWWLSPPSSSVPQTAAATLISVPPFPAAARRRKKPRENADSRSENEHGPPGGSAHILHHSPTHTTTWMTANE